MNGEDFCGCCGEEMYYEGGEWCFRCRGHIAPMWGPNGYTPSWERTYYGQHGRECPHQVDAARVARRVAVAEHKDVS